MCSSPEIASGAKASGGSACDPIGATMFLHASPTSTTLMLVKLSAAYMLTPTYC
jgi:hypothetical protein